MKKCVSIIVTLIFLCVSFSSVQSSQIKQDRIKLIDLNMSDLSSGNTIYVDDNNTEGPWDGTEEYPYKEIQDGIDAANNGDTIFVFEGNYTTCIIGKENISLIGQNKEKTKVHNDGISFSSICICSDSILIKNFTITGSNFGLDLDSNNNEIYDNIIKSNKKGISLGGSHNNILRNNIIMDNVESGIIISWSFGNIIENNTISNSTEGAAIDFDYIKNTIIRNNDIINNKYGIKIWEEILRISFTEKTKIRNNNFLNNTYSAGIKSEVSILYTKFSHNYWDRGRILPKMIYKFDYPYPLPLNID